MADIPWHKFDPTVDPEAKTLHQVALKADLPTELRFRAASLFLRTWGGEKADGDPVLTKMAEGIKRVFRFTEK